MNTALHAPVWHTSEFRFYAELNDYLPRQRRCCDFRHRFQGTPAIKDVIEAIGVPHVEIDLILVNGHSVDFRHRLLGDERVAVYPMFERLDITPLIHLRPRPLRVSRFAIDANLGRLARYLRLLGFDSLYQADWDDADLVRTATHQHRIILTRDRDLLKRSEVTHGYWVRHYQPTEQLSEVIHALQLEQALAPYTRCSQCNGLLQAVAKTDLPALVPAHTLANATRFRRCPHCGKMYWQGSHCTRIDHLVATLQKSD